MMIGTSKCRRYNDVSLYKIGYKCKTLDSKLVKVKNDENVKITARLVKLHFYRNSSDAGDVTLAHCLLIA